LKSKTSAFYLKGRPHNQQISFNFQHDFVPRGGVRAAAGSFSHYLAAAAESNPRGPPNLLKFGPAFIHQVAHSEHQLILGGNTDRNHKNLKIIRHKTENYSN
jgi:hypothetical protein